MQNPDIKRDFHFCGRQKPADGDILFVGDAVFALEN